MDDNEKLEAREGKPDEQLTKLIGQTMFTGYIVLFIIASIADNSYDCSRPPCSPFPFLVLISLVIGFVVSYTISLFSKK